MLDKLIFRLRSGSLEIGPLLGSWKLSIVLMVSAGVFYLLLTIYGFTTPSHVVGNIASLLVFQLLYSFLLLNTGVCLWNRFPKLRRDISVRHLYSGATPTTVETVVDRTAAERRLVRDGFTIVSRGSDQLFAVRNRWTALGTYLFHGAFFLIAIGFFLSAASRSEQRLRLGVGEEFTGDASQTVSRSTPRLLSAEMPPLHFRVDDIRPSLWRDQLLFTSLESDLTFLPGEERSLTKINRPLAISPVSYLRLSGFGYTPRYELVDASGAVIESAFVKMDLFPTGQRDFFTPDAVPIRVYVEIYPDAIVQDNEVINRTMNLNEPMIFTAVYRGRFLVGSGAIRLGESLEVEGLSLTFPELRYWGDFTVVRDLGVVWIFLGFLLGIIGLALKIPGRREEAVWTRSDEGEATLTLWLSRRDLVGEREGVSQ